MKRTKAHRFRAILSHIRLVDRCLLLILAVLLAQSAYSLLWPTTEGSEMEHIDVIIRTSSSAVFGYLISMNFGRRGASAKSAGSARQIGFTGEADASMRAENSDTADTAEPNVAEPPAVQTSTDRRGQTQPIVATAISLFCLIVLIILRDTELLGIKLNSSATATVAQFRDFVSAGIGYLVGFPSDGAAKK